MAQQRGSGGFLTYCLGIFAGLGLFSIAIVACLAIVCVGIIGFFALGQEAIEDAAIAANSGFGTKDKPIAAGEWVRFDNANVRVVQIIQPANAEVERFSGINPDPMTNTEYVLVSFDVECKTQKCGPFGGGFRLLDNKGDEWEESVNGVLLDNDLDEKEAIRGNSYNGWQVFEFPIDETIDLIMIRWELLDTWLYVEPQLSE